MNWYGEILEKVEFTSNSIFSTIHDKLFSEYLLENPPTNVYGIDNIRISFQTELRTQLKTIIAKHISVLNYQAKDFEVLLFANAFFSYLNPTGDLGNAPDITIAKEIHNKLTNPPSFDLDSFRLFSFDDAIKTKYSIEPNQDINEFRKMVFERENLQLIIKFEKEFANADELDAITLLENQYQRTEVTGMPKKEWLANVKLIIEQAQIIKKDQYSKLDRVELWFKKQWELLNNNPLDDIPFIGDFFNRNSNISESIIDAYYSTVLQPKSFDEVTKGYIGKLHHYNSPYQVTYFGAFMNMDISNWLQRYITAKIHPYDKVNHLEINAALQQYAKGFKIGYHSFEQINLEKNPFKDNAQKARLIFDFVIGKFGGIEGMPISFGEGVGYFDAWESRGNEEGQMYRAWYIILENHTLFTQLFKERDAELIKRRHGHEKNPLSLNHIALIAFYEHKIIGKKAADEIAKSYDFTSGSKLYQNFNSLSKRSNRVIIGASKKKIENRRKLLEEVKDLLSSQNKTAINLEIQELKKDYNSRF